MIYQILGFRDWQIKGSGISSESRFKTVEETPTKIIDTKTKKFTLVYGGQMFDNSIFEKWLDDQAGELVKKIGAGEKLSSEEMIILVLKAQSNHFEHLDKDLRADMKDLRIDMNRRFEQVDKRFDRVYSFLKWEIGLFFVAFAGIYIKLFLG